jgi:3-oxoadipate enol-lactonase
VAFLQRDDHAIHYQLEGPEDKPVLMLSHSLGADLSMWDAQAPEFSKHFRLLRYDTRGHGLSAVSGEPCSMEALGRDVLFLLDHLHQESVHFCGLSLGGMIGMWLGHAHPQRLRKLVLCNTVPWMGPREMWTSRIEAVQGIGMDGFSQTAMERWFTVRFREASPQAVSPVQDRFRTTPLAGYVACCAAIRDMDQRDSVSRIRIPTLVVAGAYDPATPAKDVRELARVISGSRYLELPAAHISNIECADEFTREVERFLRGSTEPVGAE